MYTAVAVCLYNCQEPIVQLQYTDREKASQISIDDDGGCLCFYKDISSLVHTITPQYFSILPPWCNFHYGFWLSILQKSAQVMTTVGTFPSITVHNASSLVSRVHVDSQQLAMFICTIHTLFQKHLVTQRFSLKFQVIILC